VIKNVFRLAFFLSLTEISDTPSEPMGIITPNSTPEIDEFSDYILQNDIDSDIFLPKT